VPACTSRFSSAKPRPIPRNFCSRSTRTNPRRFPYDALSESPGPVSRRTAFRLCGTTASRSRRTAPPPIKSLPRTAVHRELRQLRASFTWPPAGVCLSALPQLATVLYFWSTNSGKLANRRQLRVQSHPGYRTKASCHRASPVRASQCPRSFVPANGRHQPCRFPRHGIVEGTDRDQANQPLASIFRFLQDVALLFRYLFATAIRKAKDRRKPLMTSQTGLSIHEGRRRLKLDSLSGG